MQKLISIDLKADFGFFRKPDVNKTINQSYNLLHKPALLGILGAIIGLEGYKEKGKMPDYYDKLKHIGVGIAPLGHQKGNFQKTYLKYNNTIGYANKSDNGTLNVEEMILYKPAYRVYLLLNIANKDEQNMYQNLQNGVAEFLPYFGKNEHYAWWEKESFMEYDFEQHEDLNKTISVTTVFLKENVVKEHRAKNTIAMTEKKEDLFMYFERLPKDFDLNLYQYNIEDYVFTTFKLKNSIGMENTLYYLKKEQFYVQLI